MPEILRESPYSVAIFLVIVLGVLGVVVIFAIPPKIRPLVVAGLALLTPVVVVVGLLAGWFD